MDKEDGKGEGKGKWIVQDSISAFLSFPFLSTLYKIDKQDRYFTPVPSFLPTLPI